MTQQKRWCTRLVMSLLFSCTGIAFAQPCTPWPDSAASPSQSLAEAVVANVCVKIAPGTYLLDKVVALPPHHTLLGSGIGKTVLKANAKVWEYGGSDALLGRHVHQGDLGIQIADMTLDAAHVATYAIGAGGMDIERVQLLNGRCTGLGINGDHVIFRNSSIERSSFPTNVEGLGLITCASNPKKAANYGGVVVGAAIYAEGIAGYRNFAPVIENNTIKDSFGPALDINNVDGGRFVNNVSSGSDGWQAINLFQSSGWLISNNTIRHRYEPSPETRGHRSHPACLTGPDGNHGAAVRICSDKTVIRSAGGPAKSEGNRVTGNRFSSYYGIILQGLNQPGDNSLVPHGNDIQDNDVAGSKIGCADQFDLTAHSDGAAPNHWLNNNCRGPKNTLPSSFKGDAPR